jgi:hypothetical protein
LEDIKREGMYMCLERRIKIASGSYDMDTQRWYQDGKENETARFIRDDRIGWDG